MPNIVVRPGTWSIEPSNHIQHNHTKEHDSEICKRLPPLQHNSWNYYKLITTKTNEDEHTVVTLEYIHIHTTHTAKLTSNT